MIYWFIDDKEIDDRDKEINEVSKKFLYLGLYLIKYYLKVKIFIYCYVCIDLGKFSIN